MREQEIFRQVAQEQAKYAQSAIQGRSPGRWDGQHEGKKRKNASTPKVEAPL